MSRPPSGAWPSPGAPAEGVRPPIFTTGSSQASWWPARGRQRWSALIGPPVGLGLGLTLWRGWQSLTAATGEGGGPADHYLRAGGQETGAANLVSAVLFDYRGFDTLGEAAVVFAAVTGTALVLGGGGARYGFFGMSVIARLGLALVLPFLLVYGLHLMVFGHLTPGGGFQGGTVLATVSILLSLLYGAGFERLHVPPRAKEAGEALGGLLFILIGSVGLLLGLPFLTNLGAGFPRGTLGRLVSGGFIPLLNLVVGLKVGAGLSTLFATLGQDLELGRPSGDGQASLEGAGPPHDDHHSTPAAPTVSQTPVPHPTPTEPQP